MLKHIKYNICSKGLTATVAKIQPIQHTSSWLILPVKTCKPRPLCGAIAVNASARTGIIESKQNYTWHNALSHGGLSREVHWSVKSEYAIFDVFRCAVVGSSSRLKLLFFETTVMKHKFSEEVRFCSAITPGLNAFR